MKKIILPLAALLLLAGPAAFAQDDAAQKAARDAQALKDSQQAMHDAQEKLQDSQQQLQLAQQAAMDANRKAADAIKELKDYDEIVIKRKNDKDEKVVVEIKNDEVFVNGRPIDEFVNDEVSVKVRSPRRFELIAPSSPFRYPRSAWSLQNEKIVTGYPIGNGAFLGVMTEASENGAKIISVTDNSAAAKAGLKKDDVITKLNDNAIADHKQLTEAVSALKPDDKVKISFLRDGKQKSTTVKLGKRANSATTGRPYLYRDEMPERPEAPEPPEAPEAIAPIPPMTFDFDQLYSNPKIVLGMDARPRIGIRAQDTEDGKGVKVLGVDNESAAEKAGIRENDIITSFDGREMSSADQLSDAARAAKDKPSVKVQLKRNGKNQEVEIKVPRKLKTANL